MLKPDLRPDRAQLRQFHHYLFRRADPGTFVSFRAFDNLRSSTASPLFIEAIRVDDTRLVDRACELAWQAANDGHSWVFCSPICTFTSHDKARQQDLANGLAISVELDERPAAAQRLLRDLLGPPTLAVQSGGQWVDPETGQPEPRLHLHWALRQPSRTPAEHKRLREARDLACRLVGGDPTAVPIVHGLRWPGSWHTKNAPRLARIVAGT